MQLSKSSWELVPRLWQAPLAAAATMSPHFPSQQCGMKTVAGPVKGFTSGSRRSGSPVAANKATQNCSEPSDAAASEASSASVNALRRRGVRVDLFVALTFSLNL